MGAERLGAYGFRLVLDGAQEPLPDLCPVPEDSPSVPVECRRASVLVKQAELGQERVCAGERGGPLLDVRRDPPAIVLGFPDETTPEALVHPVLTLPISILARWRGDLTLHAGSFVANDRAWAVVGDREAGKSTTLTKIAQRGCPLMADDLLVLDGDVVRAGPACIDLRPDVAEQVPEARALGEIGDRERFRLTTPQGPARARLAGFFLMDWSEDGAVEIERLDMGKALNVVYAQEYMGLLGPADPEKILALLGTPMWRVRRPKDWRVTDEVIDGILAATAENA
jgi:hypothetical protein